MCGICGIAGRAAKNIRDELVRNMNRAIHHRGPDESGFYSSDFCTLAMSRLQIIDLVGGKQPIFSEDRTKCVFFNGEIYNYRQLKADLEAKGHRFATQSDTEVLMRMYEQYGDSMVAKLRGMFAFCICDETTKSLFFARDRFGEKPLYYFFDGHTLTFSSEIKSLLENPKVPRVLNRNLLHYYLSFSKVPEPFTLFKELYSLPPGHTMLFRDNSLTVDPYFVIDYRPDRSLQTDRDACEFIKPILQEAITQQTVSDVPLGAFLSGGIDSSTIVAFLQKNSSRRIKTFTVRFEDATYDESPIAREVASFLGTDHQEITIGNFDFDASIFWKIIDHVGLPFADSSAIPTYFISKEIRKHVTVAISGDGGDELFGGYPDFQWWQKIKGIQRYPAAFTKATLEAVKLLRDIPLFRNSNKLRQIDRALTVAGYPEREFGVRIFSMFNDNELARIVDGRSATAGATYDLLSAFPARSQDWSSLRKAMYFRIVHNLPLDMLIKVDRMSMANSLEVRAPFLDPNLFAASAKLPDDFLIRNGSGKHIIRQLMRQELPEAVFNHPKTGFSIPLHHYQNDAFRRLANELISTSSPLMKFFDPVELERLKTVGLSNKADNAKVSVYKSSHRLWMMMMLFGWAKRFNVSTE